MTEPLSLHRGLVTPKTYILLGAPSLLYRPNETYSNTAQVKNPSESRQRLKGIHVNIQALNRTRARWYYPMDHRFRRATRMNPTEVNELVQGIWHKRLRTRRSKFAVSDQSDSVLYENKLEMDTPRDNSEEAGRKKGAKGLELLEGMEQQECMQQNFLDFDDDNDDEENEVQSEGDNKREGRRKQSAAVRRLKIQRGGDWNMLDPLYDEDYQQDRSLPFLDHARLTMLHATNEDDLHIPFTLSWYRMYDHSYIPGLYGQRTAPKLVRYRSRNTLLTAQERRNFADPAYLAPFCLSSLESMTPKKRKFFSLNNRKTNHIDRSDPNSPSIYGNCLICELCPCPSCRQGGKRPSYCLLYPTGGLLDRVRVSRLILPNSVRNSSGEITGQMKGAISRNPKTELDVGDTIRQLVKCRMTEEKADGSWTLLLLARTTCHITVFRWSALQDSNERHNNEGRCWGLYKLQPLHRIDLRSVNSHFPFFTAMDVAAHPRFGCAYSDLTIAILSHSKTTRNTIHHVQASASPAIDPFVEQHDISCLSAISLIDFASAHPMTLWAAANSYVRPTITKGLLGDGPYTGNGHSLYLIDLRMDSASFQWSPSAEEFLTEGIHSISGIMTDLDKDNRLWVASVSAGKTWELDSRMPCKVVSSWSFPGLSDDFESVLPSTGLQGAGTVMSRPTLSRRSDNDVLCPILSVGKTPGTFGLHVYQPSSSQPWFQTQSLEIAGCALPSRYSASFVASSIFPLPDVSDRVFTCGLAAFRTSTEEYMSIPDIESLGCSASSHVLSALTLTNRGDIYLHALLEQSAENASLSKIPGGVAPGSSALIPPLSSQAGGVRAAVDVGTGFNLYVSLSSNLPVSSNAVLSQVVNSKQDVQPFKAIPLCQSNLNIESTERPSDWQPISHSRVGHQLVVLGKDDSIAGTGSLTIPPYDVEDPVAVRRLETNEREQTECKSDITPDILVNVATLWGGSFKKKLN